VKLGTENKTKLIVLGVLMLLALIFVGSALFSSGGSPATASAPAALTSPVTPATAAHARMRSKRPGAVPHSLDPSLRFDWLKASEDTKYEGTGRNIFLAQAEPPQPVAKPNTDDDDDAQKGPPPPPPPPPINLKFFGFASKPGEAKKIFLSQGEDVFIASEGDVVNRHYKVLHIMPTSVEIEDVLNNNRQSIPLTAG